MENNYPQYSYETKPNKTKTWKVVGIIAAIIIVAVGVWYYVRSSNGQGTNLASDQYAVAGITNAFGANLKMVSLLSPTVGDDMDRQYKPFVTADLLAAWKANPMTAPGRETSSPYPDKIEIASVTMVSKNSYIVTGNVSEVTTGSKGSTTQVSVYPVKLTFSRVNCTWLISALEKGETTQSK